MKVFIAKGFTGHWPVGTHAVIVAESRSRATKILNEKLWGRKLLLVSEEELVEVDPEVEGIVSVDYGEY